MVDEQRGRHRLGELRGGVGLDPHAPLLQHHVPLGGDHGVVEDEAVHPVGLEAHHRAEMVPGHPLEIGGVVVAGEGVLLAAEAGDGLREGAHRVLLGALEHQVLEEVGDAGLAERIIGRTVAVPDHVGRHRRPVVRHHHHIEVVVEGEGRNLRPPGLGAPEGGGLAPAGGGSETGLPHPGKKGGRPEQVHTACPRRPPPSAVPPPVGRNRNAGPLSIRARQKPYRDHRMAGRGDSPSPRRRRRSIFSRIAPIRSGSRQQGADLEPCPPGWQMGAV